ncbi:MAG: TonB-dependent receptor, partial [Chitinophagia bacterium]|nr:TonB-dependent receptor [Chitinophagia bacterium]
DYVGLPNRSKHQAQFKLWYQPAEGSFLYLRLIYRSRWTIANSNGNGVHDLQDEHAAGFVQANISGGITLSSVLQLQAGIDNLFNYQDLNYMPNFQGRTVYLTIRHHFNQLKNRK